MSASPADDREQIVNTLTSFWTRMNEWERTTSQRVRSARKRGEDLDAVASEADEELQDIMKRFAVLPSARGLQFQIPPEYDAEKEGILSVESQKPGHVVVTTKQTAGFGKTCVYELVSQSGSWRIISRSFVDHSGKRVPLSL